MELKSVHKMQLMSYKNKCICFYILYHFLNKTLPIHFKNTILSWSFYAKTQVMLKFMINIVSDFTCNRYESPCQLALWFRKEHSRCGACPYGIFRVVGNTEIMCDKKNIDVIFVTSLSQVSSRH